ncbi:hypothetical protein GCM10010221_59090 [Streptomyces parvus]|nr:hypothetical protein GCM10010221_59090 [Streptomyces parvus]
MDDALGHEIEVVLLQDAVGIGVEQGENERDPPGGLSAHESVTLLRTSCSTGHGPVAGPAHPLSGRAKAYAAKAVSPSPEGRTRTRVNVESRQTKGAPDPARPPRHDANGKAYPGRMRHPSAASRTRTVRGRLP